MISINQFSQLNPNERNFIIKGHLSEGLCVLGARPKIGKTLMGVQLMVDISHNRKVLGKLSANKVKSIYLSGEESVNDLSLKVERGLENRELEKSLIANCYIDDMESFEEGDTLYDIILEYAEQYFKLIIIDPLVKFLDGTNMGSNSFVADYQFANEIKELIDEYNLCVILIHHTTKSTRQDIFDELLGSRGLLAAADTMMVLHSREKNKAVLSFRGRYIAEKHYSLSFNELNLEWSISEEEKIEIELTPEREDILQIFKEKHPEELSTSYIASRLGKTQSTISTLCRKMFITHLTKGSKYGFYKLVEKKDGQEPQEDDFIDNPDPNEKW